MIEIEEKDIERSYDADKFYLQITKIFDSEKEADEFGQRMLQDHEDAKKWKEILWNNGNGISGEQIRKDRQTVKRLEKFKNDIESHEDKIYGIKFGGNFSDETVYRMICTFLGKDPDKELLKIREGKK